MTSWLCWHVGTVADPKLTAVAKRCGNVPKHLVIAFWAYLLEVGAEAEPRGSIESLDIEDAAIVLDCTEEILVKVLEAMEAKEMVKSCQISAWEKRQFNKSTNRVRAFRERKKQNETDETVSNVLVTTGQDITGQDIKKKDRPTLDSISVDEELKTLAFPLDASFEIEKFRDYHRAKGTKIKDARAAFKNWLRKAKEFATEKAPRNALQTPNGPVSSDLLAKTIKRAVAEDKRFLVSRVAMVDAKKLLEANLITVEEAAYCGYRVDNVERAA